MILDHPLSLGSDNHSGVHPKVLEALVHANIGHSPSYGTDQRTETAMATLKSVFGKTAHPFFVFNGTAANVLALQAMTQSFESIIAASTSHLNQDECGAPEKHIGCKLITIPSRDGKISPQDIEPLLVRGGDQHYSQARVVSITLPTEYGTCYSLEELRALREFTREKGLYLHIDGARLIYAAHYLQADLRAITEGLGADAVSFGGTKNGLLFGEVVLLYHQQHAAKFKYIRKQGLQLPSKQRFLAAQFCALLDGPGLWREIASSGHRLAVYLAESLKEFSEVKVTQQVNANSVFAIFPKSWIKPLRESFFFYVWDEKTFEVRLMISYDITQKDIDQFLSLLRKLKNEKIEKR